MHAGWGPGSKDRGVILNIFDYRGIFCLYPLLHTFGIFNINISKNAVKFSDFIMLNLKICTVYRNIICLSGQPIRNQRISIIVYEKYKISWENDKIINLPYTIIRHREFFTPVDDDSRLQRGEKGEFRINPSGVILTGFSILALFRP